MASQTEELRQTRSSWLSIARNFREEDPQTHRPAFLVMKTRLAQFAQEFGAVGRALVGESETNLLSDARFMYRLGTTISAWSEQQREMLLANCAALDERDRDEHVYESFNLGAICSAAPFWTWRSTGRVVSVLQGASGNGCPGGSL